MIIDSFINEYVVDGINNIRDPLGMVGKRLEVSMLMIDAFAPSVKNITKCLETLGAHAGQTVLGPLASASSVLTKQQKELGVVLIDIGFGKTSVAIYEEERLIHAAIIPVGANNITNDLAIGLRIPIETAEIIKLQFGNAVAKEVGSRDVVELAKIDPRAKGIVTKKFIAEIIEDRLAEIFELVNNEVKLVGKASQLPAGAVLVGGGAKMPGIAELARQELKLSAHIGTPHIEAFNATSAELAAQAEDPQLACAIGLLQYESQLFQKPTTTTQAPQWLKKLFDYFVP
jgi:cell division protein FtsA